MELDLSGFDVSDNTILADFPRKVFICIRPF